MHEIGQHCMAMFGGDAFGMELHTMYGKGGMPEPHNMAIVAGRIYDQLRWDILDYQGMVTRRGEWRGQTGEQSRAIMRYRGCFAMHQAPAGNRAAEMLANCLMPKANT